MDYGAKMQSKQTKKNQRRELCAQFLNMYTIGYTIR